MTAQPFDQEVVFQIRMLIQFGEQHLHPGEGEERAKHVENPAELVDQRSTQANHDGAQYQHAHDPPEQHLVLVLTRDGQEAEDHRHEEHVVHRQRFFDQKAGVEVHAGVTAFLHPHPQAEQQAGADIAG